MKKLLLLGASSLALTTSCVSNFGDDYNANPKQPTVALASGLVSNAERTLVRTVNSANVNLNPLRFYVQYWVATDYPNESQYDLNTRAIPTGYWNSLYRDCIRDLREAKTTIPNDITVSTASKNNALAITEILEIYAWANLVETFGNIPYSEAFDVNITQPKYDDQTTIYTDLIARLNAATSKLDVSQPTGFGVNELIYSTPTVAGTTASWVKFANAMKLRMALIIADADPSKAKTLAEAAAGKLPSSNSEAVDLAFNGTFPNTNPLNEDLVRSGRTDFAGSNIFINALKGTGGPSTGTPVTGVVDPRLNDYFNTATSTSVPAGTYAGGTEGTTNSKSIYSLPGSKLNVVTLPGVLISYAQVELMQAEAIERGFAMGGTAASHYNAGVTASILEWGGTTTEATTYLAQPTITYTGGSAYKQQIGYQYWVALYNQPTESWTQWRRLDYPQLPLASGAIYPVIPRRFLYPTVEQNLNNANYTSASAAIGGDDVATKLFWDKF